MVSEMNEMYGSLVETSRQAETNNFSRGDSVDVRGCCQTSTVSLAVLAALYFSSIITVMLDLAVNLLHYGTSLAHTDEIVERVAS